MQAALECDNAQEMPLQNAAPLAVLVDELSDTIGIEEAAQWAESMIGNTVTFADLLPASITPKTWEQMNARRVVCSGRRNDLRKFRWH
jgi:hypothetical protein